MQLHAFALVASLILTLATLGSAADIRCAASGAKLADADGDAMAKDVAAQLGSSPKAFILFARGQEADQRRILDAIRKSNPDVPLIGCFNEAGAFAVRNGAVATGEVLLVGLTGDAVTFKTAIAEFPKPKDLVPAARKLAGELRPADGRGLMLLITDAAITHNDAYDPVGMYAALHEVFGPQVALVGGNAAYGDKPVYFNDTIATRAMVGLMISGQAQFKVVQETGKTPISPPLKITKTAGRRQIVELEGRPWMDVYKEYLKDYLAADKFDEAIQKGGGAFQRVSIAFPHAIVMERNQLHVRLAHGLAPWGKGTNLPVEASNLPDDAQLVITRRADDQVACVRAGLDRLKANMLAGPQLFMLFPCDSNSALLMSKSRKDFFAVLAEQIPQPASAFGFFPCGEHASLYEPDLDSQVIPARYHQLSYPMSLLVAAPPSAK